MSAQPWCCATDGCERPTEFPTRADKAPFVDGGDKSLHGLDAIHGYMPPAVGGALRFSALFLAWLGAGLAKPRWILAKSGVNELSGLYTVGVITCAK
jgi:hypothetical protein